MGVMKEIDILVSDLSRHEDDAQEILDEMVHELKSREGSSINNQGMHQQLLYLLTYGVSEDEIYERLKEKLSEHS